MNHAERGAWSAAAAFLIWGLSPIYWKLLDQVGRGELLAHRLVWSLAFMLVLVLLRRRGGELKAALASPGEIGRVVLRSLLLSVNWLIFLWGIQQGFIVECSLGYFINPLVSVLLGAVFLGERMSRLQKVALLLAGLGVANLILNYGRIPWVALVLAGSFGFYGLLRKTAKVGAVTGFAAECSVLAPFALVALLATGSLPGTGNGTAWRLAGLLIGSGIITSLPLILFAYGTRRIRLSTLGFLQYIAPTCQFLLGVFVYEESFTRLHLLTFGLIWIAVVLYCRDAVLAAKRPENKVTGS